MCKLITFGVFDLLHVGHIHLFEQASKYGEIIVVTADDPSIHQFKSADRPIIPLDDRVRMLQAVKSISEVKSFSFTMENIMQRHEEVIREVNPDIFVQGEQANHEYIYPILKRLGIPILTVNSLKTSTTQIIKKIRSTGNIPENYSFPSETDCTVLQRNVKKPHRFARES